MAADLRDRVERSMIERGTSVVLCVFSATSFNTASPVNPDFHDVLLHAPTLLTLFAIFAIGATALATTFLLFATVPRLTIGSAKS
jgi:hypothetical protein